MRIDVHAHYFPLDYLEQLERDGGGEVATEPGRRSAWPSEAEDLAARLVAMDRAGVDLQILSIASANPYLSDEAHAVAGARTINDCYAAVVQKYPQRFAAFGALPLPHITASLEELGRALDDLKMLGITVTTTIAGVTLTDEAFAPIYRELDARGSVLFIHPIGRACDSPVIVKSGLSWALGAPFEDTLCAMQLLQAGFATRYPHIRVIVPHLGGTVPFLAQRLDHMAQRFMPGLGTPTVELRKFWYDTVNGYPPSLRCACSVYGVDRVLFGTDYPFWRDDAHQLAADYVAEAGLAVTDISAIFEHNTRALFGSALHL